jgi:hypothetical protein
MKESNLRNKGCISRDFTEELRKRREEKRREEKRREEKRRERKRSKRKKKT